MKPGRLETGRATLARSELPVDTTALGLGARFLKINNFFAIFRIHAIPVTMGGPTAPPRGRRADALGAAHNLRLGDEILFYSKRSQLLEKSRFRKNKR